MLDFLKYTVHIPVGEALAVVLATTLITTALYDWYWTSIRTDADAAAHFTRATWRRRILWIVGIGLGVLLYLALLLK